MGRPRLPRDEAGNIVRERPKVDPPSGGNPTDTTPERIVSGRPNPLYYAHLISEANQLARQHISNGMPLPWNHDAYIKGVMTEAKMAGVDLEEIADHRTEIQQLADGLMEMALMPDVLWEKFDADAAIMRKGMDNVDESVVKYVEERFKAEQGGSADLAGKLQRLKNRMDLVLSLRERARNPLPRNSYTQHAHQIKAAHLLRFMLYVGRSNIPSEEPGGTIFKIGKHHAKMAWDIYEAENGIEITYDHDTGEGKITPGRIPYIGVQIICPLRHGKSEIAAHYTTRAICLRPEIQAVMLHAVAAEAEKNLQYVASCFDRKNSVGRRCMSLFPISLEKSTNQMMRVKLGRPLKQATLEAYGFMSGRLGINTSLQIWDDIVPQSDQTEETTRKRRFDKMGGTWKSRQQGKGTFILSICTLWHHDDVNSRIIKLASDRGVLPKNRLMFRVSKQKCGGPRTTPKYYPLWPEMYDSAWLRQQAAGMTPATYSAAFESNPISAEGRIVKELRLYDQGAEEHAEFLKRAVRYISLDPSGVNRKGADKAGFVYGAAGEVVVKTPDPEVGMKHTSREVLRILAAKQFNATQTDLVEFACGFAAERKTDYVLTEQQGLSAIASIFEKYHGIAAIPIPAGNKDKETRLRRVAGMIDEAQARVGGPCAVVEFPGIREGDRLVLDPDFKELAEQILDFGVAVHDGLLDATTQLAYFLMPNLQPGVGEVSRIVREATVLTPMQRLKKAALDGLKAKNSESAAEQDFAWSCRWTSN